MITLVNDYSQLTEHSSIYSVKIRSNMLTYGVDLPFMLTWRQGQTYIQKLDNNMIISAHYDCDYDEIAKFIKIIGYENIFTDRKTADLLKLNAYKSGIIMIQRSYTSPVSSGFKPPPFPEYKRLYKLLVNCGITVPDYDSFLSDLFRRINHGTARLYTNDDYTAAAFTAFEDEKNAVISAVATDESHRRCGLGSTALNTLCDNLSKDAKTIYLYREPNKNELFYVINGFENYGEFVLAR